MLELSIPQPGEDSKNAKDLVFTILTQEQPLSLIELTNRIHASYNLNLSYQAIRKAVNALHEEGVLIKEGKRYRISKDWVLSLKSFFDKLLEQYESGTKVHKFTQDMAKENYAVYTLHTMLDVDNFWNDVLMHWMAHEKENKVHVSYYHYGWWFLFNLGEETKLYESYRKHGIKTYALCYRDLPLNRWGLELYRQSGTKTQIIDRPDLDEAMAVNILGDMIIQVRYPPHLIKRIRKFYEKYNNIQNMSPSEITQIVHEPCEIKMTIIKNPTMAKELREKYLKMF
jgi:hypothetical protein